MRIITFLLIFPLALMSQTAIPQDWKQIAPGMDLQNITSKIPDRAVDITVIRFDPELWELVFMGIGQTGEATGKTAREWCKRNKLTAAINGGMFADDFKKHVGYLRIDEHVYNSQVNNYQSVLAFNPGKNKSIPVFQIIDLDGSGVTMQSVLNDYNSVVQNLRLIKKPGINQWKNQNGAWCEAAIGEDIKGRILFIYSRLPLSMHDLNQKLLNSDISIIAAQHLEGKFEAQMYLHLGNTEIDLFDCIDSNSENPNGAKPFPIPNIIGIRQRK
jgi:exopolysaccharide biosynthesis protein